MCGIAGIATINPDAPIDRADVRRMADALAHRGPDGQGFAILSGAALASRRLAIVDPEGGAQPITNETSTLTLVANAEIYNAPELRARLVERGHRFRTRSDVEVILHLYEEHGAKCLDHLRGMFALALWDAPNQTLFLARDRLGIKPLCYAEAPDGTLLFASEAKAILDVGSAVDRSLDPRALADMFAIGAPLFGRTCFRGVRQLEPGHWLTFRQGRTTIRRYWDLSFDPPDDRPSEDEWIERFGSVLREAVSIHRRADVPVGAWLSPGIDSSAVVALAAARGESPLETFTMGFDDPRFDERRRHATLDVLSDLPIRNTIVHYPGASEALPRAVWHQEQPDGLHLASWALAAASSKRFKVVLTGQGADEVLAGYEWYRAEKVLAPLALLPVFMRRLLVPTALARRIHPYLPSCRDLPSAMSPARFAGYAGSHIRRPVRAALTPELARAVADAEACEHDFAPPAEFASWSRFHQLAYIETKTRLPSFIIQAMDRVSMAHSLEARVPFLDHKLVELCASMPAPMKLRGMREKHVLREAMRPLLPREIVDRRKRALYYPAQDLSVGSLAEPAAELLSERALREKGYFEPARVAALRGAPANDGTRRALAFVFGLQLWDELFLRQRARSTPSRASSGVVRTVRVEAAGAGARTRRTDGTPPEVRSCAG